MTEKEIKVYAGRLRAKIAFFMFVFFVGFELILQVRDKSDDTLVLIFFACIFTLWCASYFVEKLIIAAMAETKE